MSTNRKTVLLSKILFLNLPIQLQYFTLLGWWLFSTLWR